MTAALASMGPISWTAAIVGSLCLYASLVIGAGRFCAMSDPGEVDTQPAPPLSWDDVEFINVIPAEYPLPPVPPLRTVTAGDYDADLPPWLFDQPSDPLTQDEFDRSEDILRGVA